MEWIHLSPWTGVCGRDVYALCARLALGTWAGITIILQWSKAKAKQRSGLKIYVRPSGAQHTPTSITNGESTPSRRSLAHAGFVLMGPIDPFGHALDPNISPTSGTPRSAYVPPDGRSVSLLAIDETSPRHGWRLARGHTSTTCRSPLQLGRALRLGCSPGVSEHRGQVRMVQPRSKVARDWTGSSHSALQIHHVHA